VIEQFLNSNAFLRVGVYHACHMGDMRLLSGWKQIAAYLKQGVRTIQRWEVLGLPIHRIRGGGQVVAFAEELDAWEQHAPVRYADLLAKCNASVDVLRGEVRVIKAELRRIKAELRRKTKPK
jgi:phage terminase Nu1 subunit (DNA packaging protein)